MKSEHLYITLVLVLYILRVYNFNFTMFYNIILKDLWNVWLIYTYVYVRLKF